MTTTPPTDTAASPGPAKPSATRTTAAELEADRKTVLGRLAGRCYDRRRVVLGIWVGMIIVLNIVAFAEPGVFRNDFGGGNSQSQQTLNFLKAKFPAQAGDSAQVVFSTTTPITSPANKAQIGDVLAALKGMPYITSVTSPFGAPGQISSNGLVAFGTLQFDRSSFKLTKTQVKPILVKAQSFDRAGFDVQLGGAPIEQAETPVLGSTEGIGILAAIIILLIAFGSVIAMGLPDPHRPVRHRHRRSPSSTCSATASSVPTFGPSWRP